MKLDHLSRAVRLFGLGLLPGLLAGSAGLPSTQVEAAPPTITLDETPSAPSAPSTRIASVRVEPLCVRVGIEKHKVLIRVLTPNVVSLTIQVPAGLLLRNGLPMSVMTLVDDGTNGDQTPGDGVYTVDNLELRTMPDVIGRSGFSSSATSMQFHLGDGTTEDFTEPLVLIFRYIAPSVPIPTPVALAPDVQTTGYVAAILSVPEGAYPDTSFDSRPAALRYYTLFRDDRDFLLFEHVVHPASRPNASFSLVRNDVNGIGSSIFDNSSIYGSNGVLQGFISLYSANSSRFDIVNHELLHRWASHLDASLDLSAQPGDFNYSGHWSGIERTSTGFAGDAAYAGAYGHLEFVSGDTYQGWNDSNVIDPQYSDVERYLMGLIAVDSVSSPIRTLVNPVFQSYQVIDGIRYGIYHADGLRDVTTAELIAVQGPRIPDHGTAQKNFNAAMIVLHDRPLTTVELAYYEFAMKEFAKDSSSTGQMTFEGATDGLARLSTHACATSLDIDGDRFCVPTDCDNSNASVFPGAPELCDGADDDCDGTLPEVELDPDQDGWMTCRDNCPAVANASQADSDGDAIGDACDACPADPMNDFDGDGVCVGSGFNTPMAGDHDNCPEVGNPSQQDTDGDSGGDACDCSIVDPATHAGALELCDGIDNDCSGRIDDAAECDGTCATVQVSGGTSQSSAPNPSREAAMAWNGSEFGLVWVDERDANQEIYFAILDASGVRTGAEHRISNGSGVSAAPDIAWTGVEWGVMWHENGYGNYEVAFQRLTRAGDPILASPRRVTTNGALSLRPSLVWNGHEYGVAWSDARYGNQEILFARLDAGGATLSEVRLSNDGAVSDYPDVAWSGSEFGVVWQDGRTGGTQVFFARADAAGQPVGIELGVMSNPNLAQHPGIVWDGAVGRYAVAWDDKQGSDYNIYLALLDGSGTKVSTDVIAATALATITEPSLVDTGAEYGIAFRKFIGNYEIYFTRVTLAGVATGADSRLTNSAGNSWRPSMAWAGDSYVVAWEDDRSGAYEILSARIGCSTPGEVPASSVRASKTGPDLTIAWGSSCGTAFDYTVYEGDLTVLRNEGTYSHVTRVCTDGGRDFQETLAPSAGDRYYLVVPRNLAGNEGDYGNGRPVGVDEVGCGVIGQQPGSCP